MSTTDIDIPVRPALRPASLGGALERGLVTPDERVLLFNCAAGNKYPLVPTAPRMLCQKLGQPVPLSNFMFKRKSSAPHARH